MAAEMRLAFCGRVAVVTGGASGIGEVCVHVRCAGGGARVVVADRNEAAAQAVAAADAVVQARCGVPSSGVPNFGGAGADFLLALDGDLGAQRLAGAHRHRQLEVGQLVEQAAWMSPWFGLPRMLQTNGWQDTSTGA